MTYPNTVPTPYDRRAEHAALCDATAAIVAGAREITALARDAVRRARATRAALADRPPTPHRPRAAPLRPPPPPAARASDHHPRYDQIRSLLARSATRLRESRALIPLPAPPLPPETPPTAPDAAPLPHPNLPPRHRQTLDLLLAGRAEKQVAAELKISRHTVHLYVTALYRHFDVHSRAELLAKCLLPP